MRSPLYKNVSHTVDTRWERLPIRLPLIAASSQALLSDIPSTLLQAELAKRQDESSKPVCGSGKAKDGYNTSLHVFALILILALSTAGEDLPIPFKSLD